MGPRAPSKAAVPLAGRPLLLHPLATVGAACASVAVVAKRDTALPALPEGVERLVEPEAPRHPLAGIVCALRRADGPVLVCAADMPFVTVEGCRRLLAAAEEARGGHRAPAAVVAANGADLEPLFGVYLPAALAALAGAPSDVAVRYAVAALDPVRVQLPAAWLRSVNTPADLAVAERELAASD
jgi:molybdopterin-guanine dinucleotide biosynthesis protein A